MSKDTQSASPAEGEPQEKPKPAAPKPQGKTFERRGTEKQK